MYIHASYRAPLGDFQLRTYACLGDTRQSNLEAFVGSSKDDGGEPSNEAN